MQRTDIRTRRRSTTWSMHLLAAMVVAAVALFSSPASAFRWVYNYNHPDLKWYTISTEHFEVHYPVSRKSKEEGNDHYLTAEWSARKYAKVAEEIWQPMCAEFNYYLKEKIHVVVLNQGDELTGFTIPSWDWIVMSANPGGSFYRTRGRMEWFSDVFVHEFAHVVSLKANTPMSENTFQALTGGLYENGINRGGLNQTSTGVQFPIGDGDSVFWTEGGAEYWSDNTNYNWWTASRDQNIRMTVLEGRLLEYHEWHSRANKRSWGDGERYYQQGYSFALYMRERFGDDVYAQFALEYGKAWRPQWETVIEDVTGIDAETLYWDWRKYVEERYTAQYDAVKAKGEVNGSELMPGPREWMFHDPEARDRYYQQERSGWFGTKQDDELETDRIRTGSWQFEPRISPDGKYMGWLNRGNLVVQRNDEDAVWAFTGFSSTDLVEMERNANLTFAIPFASFDHGWDFVPGDDAVVLTAGEDAHPRSNWFASHGFRFETDGYNWNRLYYYKYPPVVEEKRGNRIIKTRNPQKGRASRKWTGEWNVIPNTERGSDPAVSPDGTRIAYFEYTDGTMNLVTIGIDGSDKQYITTYDDGTWMQIVDWSPDGSQLVFGQFRNYQQNLFIVDADGSNMKPIMVDGWEEMDAHWASDGKIYFAAEPEGIFNIYSYDPRDGQFLQLTNVIGGATMPQITSDGNLIYSYYTSFGWKMYGLTKDEFMNAPANDLFQTTYDMEKVEEELAFREDMSVYDSMTSAYRPQKAVSSLVLQPVFRLTNNTLTNWGLQGGFFAQMMDYVQYHQAFTQVLLGEDMSAFGVYTYDGWYPSVSFIGGYFQGKNDQGFLLDEDQNPETTSDQRIFDRRRGFQQAYGLINVGYQWNGALLTQLSGYGRLFSLQNTDSDRGFEPFQYDGTIGINVLWSNNQFFRFSANPSFGRTVTASVNRGWTDIVFEPQGGATVDDGEILDFIQYNQVQMQWTEQLSVPTWFDSKVLRHFRNRRHTIQLDGQVGFIDRNVNINNEFNAGGRHPYNWGLGSLQSNTQFAGYPAWGLSGETMAIFGAAYRFPLARTNWSNKTGPLYVHDAALQIGGTVGNLWSFRPPTNPDEFYRSRFDERIALNEEDIRREIPFIDEAYKNGNRVLTDATVELRVATQLYSTLNWNSFIRLSYGFNSIRGFGDVDGDDIFDTNDSAIGDELSNEVEPAGLRFYLGLGTGW